MTSPCKEADMLGNDGIGFAQYDRRPGLPSGSHGSQGSYRPPAGRGVQLSVIPGPGVRSRRPLGLNNNGRAHQRLPSTWTGNDVSLSSPTGLGRRRKFPVPSAHCPVSGWLVTYLHISRVVYLRFSNNEKKLHMECGIP